MLGMFCSVHDAVEAKVSPGGGDRSPAEGVVDNFPSRAGEHVDGIGPGVTIDSEGENEILVTNRGYFVGRDEGGILNRGKGLHECAWLECFFLSAR